MARRELTAAMFDGRAVPAGPVDNAAFLPATDGKPPHALFAGVLHLAGAELASDSEALERRFVMGGRPTRFPAVDLAFTSDGDTLVPVHRGLYRRPDAESYWDVMVGPGHLWAEPGDGDRSRAAFPFQLSNERENDSHHGVAGFLYGPDGVSDVVVQKIAETRPDHLPEGFGLWGRVPASWSHGNPVGAEMALAVHRAEHAARHPLRPIEELAPRCGEALIAALYEGTGSDTEIVSGLVVDGTIYATPLRVRHGAAPFPRAMRFGLWSATKAAFGTTALQRLAMHLGPEVADARIAEVVEVTADHDGWREVTLRDCLSMASGIGTAQRSATPVDIFADNLTEPDNADAEGDGPASYHAYQAWYAAHSRADKLACAFACPSYPWGPGEVARYRDQDLFMAGVAMDVLWKRHAGPDADLFAMVAEEVYEAIGIHGADINRTIEAEGRTGVPLTAFGLYLGLDDIARLGRLLSDGGRHGGHRLLEPTLVAEALDGNADKGLPTGTTTADGEVTYHLAYWQLPYRTRAGRLVRLPSMRGYGGNIVQPLWNGITCFRLAHDAPSDDDRYDALKLPRIADALAPL